MYVASEKKLREAAAPNVEVRIKGSTASLTIVQPTFDAEGRFLGEARVTVEGRRQFGGTIAFAEPLAVTVTNAPPGEEPEFERMARFAVEALDPSDTSVP
ncbi:MAG: hypothetical protein JNJ54_22940 [Myxococcaceae bacterium]|nr:hypothetical protein [Myxococcaceae bacterium]